MALHPCHPFAGHLSVADMVLRISQYVIAEYNQNVFLNLINFDTVLED